MAHAIIVDDIDVVRLTLRKFLERGGHQVTECVSTQEVMQSLKSRSGRPDLVITDLWMPDDDGLALIGLLKSSYAGLPVIAITGGAPRSPQRVSMDAAAEMGADRVLMKPVGMEELLTCVEHVIRR